MSTANAKDGSAIEPQAVRDTIPQAPARRATSGLHRDQGLLLAQIPDLNPTTVANVPKKRVDGRIISQALSIKLVFGVGVGLLIGAILPFIFGKASRPDTAVKELPAWSSNGGSARVAESTSPAAAPTWPSWPPAPASAAVAPQTPFSPTPAILVPQPPQVGDTRPTALTEPSWLQPRSSVTPAPAITPSPAPNNYINPPVASANPPGNRAGYSSFSRPVDPRTIQADNRNDPAAQYHNNDTRYDTRYDTGSTFPPAPGSSNPLMPSGVQGPTATYPQTPEPGVARFDGTIATPPARTSYDRAGSSNN